VVSGRGGPSNEKDGGKKEGREKSTKEFGEGRKGACEEKGLTVTGIGKKEVSRSEKRILGLRHLIDQATESARNEGGRGNPNQKGVPKKNKKKYQGEGGG